MVYSNVFEKGSVCLIGIVWHEKKEVKAVDIFDARKHFAENSQRSNWLQNEMLPTWDNSDTSVFQSFAFRFCFLG